MIEYKIEYPLISVITCTLNASSVINNTINSMRMQEYKNFEWIVIDGKSSDNTVEIVRDNEDIVDHWISESDRGIADAWNKGLAIASGDAVLILNAGDVYTPDALSCFSKNCYNNKVTCSSANLLSESGYFIRILNPRPWKLSYGMHIPHNWCLVPLRFYRELGGYPEYKYSMDFAWFYSYYRKYGENGFILIDEVLGNYFLGGISDISSTESFKNNANIIIEYGEYPIVAYVMYIMYALKHNIFKWLV